MGCAATLPDNGGIGCLSRLQLLLKHRYYVPKMSINGASITFGLASWKILEQCGDIKP
jgi:hypothetical protein